MPGIRTSMITTFGRRRSASATALSPSPASPITRMCGARDSDSRRPSRTTSWSSTIRQVISCGATSVQADCMLAITTARYDIGASWRNLAVATMLLLRRSARHLRRRRFAEFARMAVRGRPRRIRGEVVGPLRLRSRTQRRAHGCAPGRRPRRSGGRRLPRAACAGDVEERRRPRHIAEFSATRDRASRAHGRSRPRTTRSPGTAYAADAAARPLGSSHAATSRYWKLARRDRRAVALDSSRRAQAAAILLAVLYAATRAAQRR